MTFSEALDAMKTGAWVRRAKWPAGRIVFLHIGRFGPQFYRRYAHEVFPAQEWELTDSSILANDWVVAVQGLRTSPGAQESVC